ncbi:MAG: hypothetical protein WDO73_06730 [Ignavibacteriota bacterium]
MEFLSADGQVAMLPYQEVRTASFVRDFDLPEDQEREVFHTRPKMAGLWVRLRFRDGELMEGILRTTFYRWSPTDLW